MCIKVVHGNHEQPDRDRKIVTNRLTPLTPWHLTPWLVTLWPSPLVFLQNNSYYANNLNWKTETIKN